MTRRMWIVIALLVASAAGVIELRHENRVAFVKLQTLQKQRDALDVEWGKLLLEEGAWAQHQRLESTARAKLGMQLPQADQIVMVDLRDAESGR
jgi:cell division protein FtsL